MMIHIPRNQGRLLIPLLQPFNSRVPNVVPVGTKGPLRSSLGAWEACELPIWPFHHEVVRTVIELKEEARRAMVSPTSSLKSM